MSHELIRCQLVYNKKKTKLNQTRSNNNVRLKTTEIDTFFECFISIFGIENLFNKR